MVCSQTDPITLDLAINFALTPLDIMGIPYFVSIGTFVLGAPPISFSPSAISEALSESVVGAVSTYSYAFMLAVIGWICVAPVSGLRRLLPMAHRDRAGKSFIFAQDTEAHSVHPYS
jgi:hypothetical protein